MGTWGGGAVAGPTAREAPSEGAATLTTGMPVGTVGAGVAGTHALAPSAAMGGCRDSLARHALDVDVATAASQVLVGYRDDGSCVLVEAGYLDLLGRVWGCVVEGDGWVDLCRVCATGDGGGSEVTVTRLDAKEWEADLEAEVA